MRTHEHVLQAHAHGVCRGRLDGSLEHPGVGIAFPHTHKAALRPDEDNKVILHHCAPRTKHTPRTIRMHAREREGSIRRGNCAARLAVAQTLSCPCFNPATTPLNPNIGKNKKNLFFSYLGRISGPCADIRDQQHVAINANNLHGGWVFHLSPCSV